MSRGTRGRTVRIADNIWEPALAKAEREGTTLSEVVREHLTRYIQATPSEQQDA